MPLKIVSIKLVSTDRPGQDDGMHSQFSVSQG